jgi:hypothetical protein
MSVKTALVVLVVVVALFVAAIVVGAGRGEGKSTDESLLVDPIKSVIGDPSAVARNDVVADCVDANDPSVLVFNGECTVEVQNRGRQIRVLKILAMNSISVDAPAPEGDFRGSHDVIIDEGGEPKEVRIAVGEGETEIGLVCLAGLVSECRAQLLAE